MTVLTTISETPLNIETVLICEFLLLTMQKSFGFCHSEKYYTKISSINSLEGYFSVLLVFPWKIWKPMNNPFTLDQHIGLTT